MENSLHNIIATTTDYITYNLRIMFFNECFPNLLWLPFAAVNNAFLFSIGRFWGNGK